MAPPQPPGLMDDLIGEILLRLPPQDPEGLVRASLVCKPWPRLLSDPGFSRRYREFHGSPPLLGFLHNHQRHRSKARRRFFFPRFIPIKEASPILAPKAPKHDCYISDCRHGRVLLVLYSSNSSLIIWDPIANSQRYIGLPEFDDSLYEHAAAVLCAVDTCDHLGCRGGPSLVVFIEIDQPWQQGVSASARVYSTVTGKWNAGISSVHLGTVVYGRSKLISSSLLVEAAIYFVLEEGRRILKYNLAGCHLLVMRTPPLPLGNMVLMKAEGGGLGACGVEGQSLHLWAWRTDPGGIWEWKQGRVIQLDVGDVSRKLDVVDFAEGAGSIFLRSSK